MSEREELERGWLAASYLLGRRGETLDLPFDEPSARGRAMAEELRGGASERRARCLAGEIGRWMEALGDWDAVLP